MPESTHEAADTAVDRVVREHAAVLERVVWGYVDNGSDRDDLMQEILVALWRALPRFRGDASERTFVLRVAHNRGITFAIRHRHRHRHRTEGLSEEVELRDPAPLADERLIAEQSRSRLWQAIRGLPAAQRQAVMLRLEGLSQREIAEVQGTSETNVGVRLTRARKTLRALLVEGDG